MSDAYRGFLARKQIVDPDTGMARPPALPSCLKPHQRDIATWALRRGRSAIFAGTGLGKTLIELVWGAEVARYTGKPVLIFTPLAVTAQHLREAHKFGLTASAAQTQADVRNGNVFVSNYQKIGHFDLSQFGGLILDESSILKSTDGYYRNRLIDECSTVPFRLAATATPAPNDFMELGNHAEFLGVMSYTDMLATFFTHDGGDTQKWRLKGHAENEFWKWMASWSVMIRKPSDLGYPDDGYDLPPLAHHQHTVGVKCIDLWSNPGDVVLTPFLGIGSEVYSAVKMGRRGIGIELKPSYFRQAAKNIAALGNEKVVNLFSATGT